MRRAILTCSPHFTELALNEVRRYHPDITLVQAITPGHLVLQTSQSFDKLTAPWRHKLPIYLHHAFPLREILPLVGNADDLLLVKQAARRIAPADATIQVRSAVERELPYSVLEIEQALIGSVMPSVSVPNGRILSILVGEDEQGLRAYLGVSWARQNISPWAGGQIPILEPVSNRAGYKLLESLKTFSIHLQRGDHALDLGAAPGAWTTLLRRRGVRVTAVAPTPMYPWLTFDADVIYHATRAEVFLDQCQTTFDLIVNDMWLDARDSARLMVDYSRHLRPEGIAIMTLKLHGKNMHRNMDHTFRLLRKAYQILRVRQLVSNRKEVTLFLRRKA